jgi:hypothetical protein
MFNIAQSRETTGRREILAKPTAEIEQTISTFSSQSFNPSFFGLAGAAKPIRSPPLGAPHFSNHSLSQPHGGHELRRQITAERNGRSSSGIT